MRSIVAVVAGALASACTGIPEPPLDLDAPVTARDVAAPFAILPDTEPEPGPAPGPVGERPGLVVLEPEAEDADACFFEVEAIGLPAVRDDGRVVVFVESDPTGGADAWVGGDELVTVDLVDVEGSDRRRLTEDIAERGGEDARGTIGDVDAESCRAYERRLRARVRDYNAELRRYRAMQQLDVVVVDTERYGEIDPSKILAATDVAPELRPVQALYRAGWFALRVPGLRVLSQEAKSAWRSTDELCDADPHILEVWGDRRSNVGVVVVDHANGGCLCDETPTIHPIAVPPAVFDELDRRPSEPYLQLVDAACEAVC
jgi:hypothetical protein